MESIGQSFISQVTQLEREVEGANGGDLIDRVEIAFQTVLANIDEFDDQTADTLIGRLERLRARLQERDEAQQSISVQDVRDTFYNLMVVVALRMEAMDSKMLRSIIGLTIIEAIENSKDVAGIRLVTGKVATIGCCPQLFRPLLQLIISNKERLTKLQPEELARLKGLVYRQEADINAQLTTLSQEILILAGSIESDPNFQELKDSLIDFVESAKSAAPRNNAPIESRDVTQEQLEGVTEMAVQQAFYELMAEHAATSGLIKKEDLESQESYIFYALSYHAIIEAMLQSKDLKGAIALPGNKALTLENCPAAYRSLAEAIFQLKSVVCRFSDDEIAVLKAHDHPDIVLEEALEALKTPELVTVAASLWRMAQEISELQTFKAIISQVIAFIADAKGPNE